MVICYRTPVEYLVVVVNISSYLDDVLRVREVEHGLPYPILSGWQVNWKVNQARVGFDDSGVAVCGKGQVQWRSTQILAPRYVQEKAMRHLRI